MDIQAAIEFLAKEGRVILQAPVTFGVAACALMAAAWAVSNYTYAARIDTLEGRIKLRDDQISDYKNKLSGATPEEAKKRIEALELKLNALSPRRISNEGKALIIKSLLGTRGIVYVSQDMAAADAKPLSADLASAFQSAGWGVKVPMLMGIANSPPSGIALRVHNPDALRPIEQTVRNALLAAGLSFDIQYGLRAIPDRPALPAGFPNIPKEPDPDAEIIITTRTN